MALTPPCAPSGSSPSMRPAGLSSTRVREGCASRGRPRGGGGDREAREEMPYTRQTPALTRKAQGAAARQRLQWQPSEAS